MTDDELQQPLARWVGEIEDIARLAARDAAAARFLLGNLVLELGRTGLLMDAHAFIDRLLVGAQQAPDQSQALQEYLQELRALLPAPDESGGRGEPGAPVVFH